MTFERWDVLTALFPFIENARSKPRPVVVLSGEEFNGTHDHIVTAMITTAAAGRWASDHPIADLAAAGLHNPCVVRWKSFSLPKDTIGRRIGVMGSSDRDALLEGLERVMAGPSPPAKAH